MYRIIVTTGTGSRTVARRRTWTGACAVADRHVGAGHVAIVSPDGRQTNYSDIGR